MADKLNNGVSGQFVMLPSGEQVTAEEAKKQARKPDPETTEQPTRKGTDK